MAAYNIYEAKPGFSALLEKAVNGEEVIIAKAGKPVARLVPVTEEQPAPTPKYYRRRAGFARGKFTDLIAEMDKPWPEDIQRAFEMID